MSSQIATYRHLATRNKMLRNAVWQLTHIWPGAKYWEHQ